jgi:hypothetical protein
VTVLAGGVLAVLVGLAGTPDGEAWQRRHWDWGQHDTGAGLAWREVPGAAPAPDWDERDAPVRWAGEGVGAVGRPIR